MDTKTKRAQLSLCPFFTQDFEDKILGDGSLPLTSRKLHTRNLALDVALERTPSVILTSVKEELSHACLANAVLIGCPVRETETQGARSIGRGGRKEGAGTDERVVIELAVIACGHLIFLFV